MEAIYGIQYQRCTQGRLLYSRYTAIGRHRPRRKTAGSGTRSTAGSTSKLLERFRQGKNALLDDLWRSDLLHERKRCSTCCPKKAASSIKEAMNELEQHVSASKSPEERLKGMNATGLLEYFLEPKLTKFPEKVKQQSRMLEIEAQEPDIAQRQWQCG